MAERERPSGSVDRRGFFRLVGVGSAAAAAAGCGKTTEAILPYVIPAEHLVPGVASWFTTVCRECPAGCGVLARVREGRVVKLEGNPEHPVNRGALCARGQAALLGTYDPDRVPRPQVREGDRWKAVTVDEAQKLLVERLAAARQAGPGRIAMITQLETGTLGRLMDDWLRAVGGRPRVQWEPFAHEDLRAASRATYGIDAIPYHAFEDARTIVSFGADYLETWVSPVGYAGGFRRAREVRDGATATVIQVEPRCSMTAANADQWIPNAPGTEAILALAVLRLVLEQRLHVDLPARQVEAMLAVARTVEVEAVARQSGVPAATLRHLADVLAKGAPSLVVGSGVAASGPGSVDTAIAVNLLNHALGNVGKTVRFGPNAALGRASRYAELLALAKTMADGQVAVLIVKDANPVFTLPAKAAFAEALARVPFVVSLSSHLDETASRAHLVIPDLTPLESWGDYAPREGVWGLQQPAMGPVPRIGPTNPDALDLPALAGVRAVLGRAPAETFPGVETRPAGDVLLEAGRALIAGSDKTVFQAKTFADHLRERWRETWRGLGKGGGTPGTFDEFWEAALRRGGYWTEVADKVALQPTVNLSARGAALAGTGDHTLVVVPSSRFYDGRSANKVWLHEAPDPMTQVVYGAWVEVPAETARGLGVKTGDVLSVESPHGKLELPAWVSETLAPRTVAVATGLGHTAYGRFARGVGRSPLALLPGEADPASGGIAFRSVRVGLARTGRRIPLPTPAGVTEVDHHREIYETIGLKEAVAGERRGGVPAHANVPSMYPDLRYPEHRWGLAIDLDACTGCQACVVACQAENNVPSVGPVDVDYGRSLHWLRVERWWDRGPVGAGGAHGAVPRGIGVAHAAEAPAAGPPRARFLPMLCQHCEVAPCEPVCPVFAAYHTTEGLNAQVYNRCVGTRYCGNNCPYMVRRFNWFRADWPAPLNLQLNPDVTVRDRGVMEKCTMCVQRIIAGKDRARDGGRRPRDGEIVTACQQTCPTQAIVFGDLKDGQSRVSRLSVSGRGYHVLGELGTRPAVTYLRKVERGGGA
jgi:molybdopterin-containing oxidoreductase family iron-sulfur binding subunit